MHRSSHSVAYPCIIIDPGLPILDAEVAVVSVWGGSSATSVSLEAGNSAGLQIVVETWVDHPMGSLEINQLGLATWKPPYPFPKAY